MAHYCYARAGSTFYRFKSTKDRDAWVADGSVESRLAVKSTDIPQRLRIYGVPKPSDTALAGVTLVDGPVIGVRRKR